MALPCPPLMAAPPRPSPLSLPPRPSSYSPTSHPRSSELTELSDKAVFAIGTTVAGSVTPLSWTLASEGHLGPVWFNAFFDAVAPRKKTAPRLWRCTALRLARRGLPGAGCPGRCCCFLVGSSLYLSGVHSPFSLSGGLQLRARRFENGAYRWARQRVSPALIPPLLLVPYLGLHKVVCSFFRLGF